MGIIVKATLNGWPKRPSQWFPFVLSFEKPSAAYAFVKQASHHPSIKPDDLIVYHSELARVLKAQSNGKMYDRGQRLWSWLPLPMRSRP